MKKSRASSYHGGKILCSGAHYIMIFIFETSCWSTFWRLEILNGV